MTKSRNTNPYISPETGELRTGQNQTNKIYLEETKTPVGVKLRKYPSEQRKLLDEYLSRLKTLGLIKTCPKLFGKQHRILFLKTRDPNSRQRFAYAQPTQPPIKNNGPCPVIEAELSDLKGSKHFASLDFCSE